MASGVVADQASLTAVAGMTRAWVTVVMRLNLALSLMVPQPAGWRGLANGGGRSALDPHPGLRVILATMGTYTIGQVATAAGVTVPTVRYYERRGILPRAGRTASNYRIYDDDAIRTISFVKQAQAIGFSLDEATELLSLRELPEQRAGEVRALAASKLGDVEQRIQQLQELRGMLHALLEACPGSSGQQRCPILDALGGEGEKPLDPHPR